MEVASAMDFDFNNSSGYYTSAPSSPTRLTSDVYCEFDELLIAAGDNHHRGCLAAVPFAWEEKPGVPKTFTNSLEDEFSFDVSCDFSTDSVLRPAEDLFHGGVIKTVDRQSSRRQERERGRERGSSYSRLPSSRSRRTRSLSPLGISDHRREQQLRATYMIPPPPAVSSSSSEAPSRSSSENGSWKWSFMDLLLFRSASDGRAMERDPLKKYSANFRKHDQDIRNSNGSVSKRRGRVSAHEIHYTVNRAVSNDMKKKTYLPYKQGILGRFSFNP